MEKISEIEKFNRSVKHTRYENLSASSDIGAGVLLGYNQALKDNSIRLYSKEGLEKLAMDSLKDKWSHLYQFGYPQKPYPTNYENDLNCIMLGMLLNRNEIK